MPRKVVWKPVRVDKGAPKDAEPLWKPLVSRGAALLVGLVLIYGGWRTWSFYTTTIEAHEASVEAEMARNIPDPNRRVRHDGRSKEQERRYFAGAALTLGGLGGLCILIGVMPTAFWHSISPRGEVVDFDT